LDYGADRSDSDISQMSVNLGNGGVELGGVPVFFWKKILLNLGFLYGILDG
jgi:hypothetical protein